MGLPRRDTRHHTYADYLTWREDVRYELIGRPAISETEGQLAIATLPGITIDWDRVFPSPSSNAVWRGFLEVRAPVGVQIQNRL